MRSDVIKAGIEKTPHRSLLKSMGYTDEEMEIFRSDPEKVKMVTQTPEFVKYSVIAEVIESHGCHAGHKVGDRFVMTAGGQLIAEKSPKGCACLPLDPSAKPCRLSMRD